LTECVTVDGVLEHAKAFQAIADANGGNRASGTPGYRASADYVEGRTAFMQKRRPLFRGR
jgi:hypothetical protein